MNYFYVKAFHIISVVTWFAGLFYIVRLFIYNVEANEKEEAEKNILQTQFKIMQRRLWNAITVPSMIATAITGLLLLHFQDLKTAFWLHAKFTILILLFAYHFWCGKVRKQLDQANYKYSSKSLRIANEIPTLLLVSIVLLAVTKNISSSLFAFGGFLIVLLILVVFFLKRLQGKSKEVG